MVNAGDADALIQAWRARAARTVNIAAHDLVDAYHKGIGDGLDRAANELEAALRKIAPPCASCEAYRIAIEDALRILKNPEPTAIVPSSEAHRS